MRAPPADGSDRSVSVALNYVLVLGISTVLIAGLLVAGTTFVEDNRERVIDSELTVIGSHIAGNIEQVDRFVDASRTNAGTAPAVAYLNQSFEERVTGSTYSIEVVDGNPPQLRLRSVDPAVTVQVNVTVNADIAETTVEGGTVSIYYDTGADRLVVTDG